MITLTLSTKLIPTTNAILFSKDLDKNLKELELVANSFHNFCEVCRIFTKRFDPSFENSILTSKIRFEIHSGSLIGNYEDLNRELEIIIMTHRKSKIELTLENMK